MPLCDRHKPGGDGGSTGEDDSVQAQRDPGEPAAHCFLTVGEPPSTIETGPPSCLVQSADTKHLLGGSKGQDKGELTL